jgi:hypothetical protein
MKHVVMCGLPGCTLFFTLSHKRHGFRKKKRLDIKCVFWFSVLFFYNISHSKKNWARYDKNVCVSSCKVPVIFVGLEWNLIFLGRFYKKYSKIKFHENPYSGSRVPAERGTDGRTDGQTEMAKVIVFAVLGTRLKMVLGHGMWCHLTFRRCFKCSCCLCYEGRYPRHVSWC